MPMKKAFVAVIIAAVAAAVLPACSINIYNYRNETVSVFVSSGGSDANTGLSRLSPLLTLQTAVNLAKASNATALYISGNFFLTNTNATYGCGVLFDGMSNLTVSGGWNPSFVSRSGESVLNGYSVADHVLMARNSDRLTFEYLAITLGFTGSKNGGGVFLTNSTWCSFNCTVTNNYALDGGGYYLIRSDRNTIAGTVSSNAADSYGGGLRLDNSFSNTISAAVSSNEVLDVFGAGGGISLDLADYTFLSGMIVDNYSGGDGGGLNLSNSQNCEVSSSIIYNISDYYGGGIGLFSGSDNNTFTASCKILSNRCDWINDGSYRGGGLYSDGNNTGNLIQTSATNPNFRAFGAEDNIFGSY